MDDEQSQKPPTPLKGWKSPSQLRREGRGNMYALTRELESLREDLIRTSQQGGLSETQARSEVEDHMIGHRKPISGGKPSLYASPEAWNLIFSRLPAEAKEGWRSSTQLERDGYRAGHHQILRKLAEFRVALSRDLDAAGYSPSEAAALIDDHLIGQRRSQKGTGGGTLYASDDAVSMMEREEILKRRSEANRKGTSSDSISNPGAKLLLEATQRLEQRGDRERADKFYRLIAQEFQGTREALISQININGNDQQTAR